jgi:hypothetical protein
MGAERPLVTPDDTAAKEAKEAKEAKKAKKAKNRRYEIRLKF